MSNVKGQWVPIDGKWHYIEMILQDGKPIVMAVDGVRVDETE